ncbi:MAG: lipid A export permease/ATP-binding protein MsbA [Deltaproteobacteria bacterium]|nr:lipid A export permease/ATP-binding protein MsbA [Deltaproteobacteria bacterium]
MKLTKWRCSGDWQKSGRSWALRAPPKGWLEWLCKWSKKIKPSAISSQGHLNFWALNLNLYRRLLQFVKPYWTRLAAAMVCMLFVSASTAASAFLVKPVLDDVFFKKDLTMLKLIPLAIVGLFLLKGFFDYGQAYLMSHVGQRIIADLREKIYSHLQSLSLSFFTRNPTGVLMSRITNDVTLVQGAVTDAVTGLLKDFFTIIGLVGVIFYRDWSLAIVALVVFPLAVYPIVNFGRKLRSYSFRSQSTMGDISSILMETISGNRIVKAFNMEDYERKRFARENRRLLEIILKSVRVRAISHPLMETLGGLGIAFIVFYGGYNVIKGVASPGTFFSFLAALLMLYEPVKRLSGVNNTIQQGLAAASRIFEVLDTVPEIHSKPGSKVLSSVSKGIEFQNVSFKYEEDWVLKNINLQIKAGEVVAFVGSSGGGKTTLVNLLPRFYDVTAGGVLIDGGDIRDLTVESLRSMIGIVTQQTILFNDSARNNIAYGKIDQTFQEIVRAAEAAYAHKFIQNLPKGYDTVIGEQGVKLSGGERQRLSIARALLKNAPILILDEATSSLDSESEIEVQKALEYLMQGRTTLVIAHRLSTIRKADRIVVISNGMVVEEGSHEELLERGGEYKKLYLLQFIDGDLERASRLENEQKFTAIS